MGVQYLRIKMQINHKQMQRKQSYFAIREIEFQDTHCFSNFKQWVSLNFPELPYNSPIGDGLALAD
jgi:hypothetical protein